MSLSEKLGLLSPRTVCKDLHDVRSAIEYAGKHYDGMSAVEVVEADRRATVDRVVWFLAHHQDAQGVDTWPARRALRELLEGGGDG